LGAKRGLWIIAILLLLSMFSCQRWRGGLISRGGKRVAEKWGTKVMENEEGSLTADMVRHLRPIWSYSILSVDRTGECGAT
jgi:hypothetical protein